MNSEFSVVDLFEFLVWFFVDDFVEGYCGEEFVGFILNDFDIVGFIFDNLVMLEFILEVDNFVILVFILDMFV